MDKPLEPYVFDESNGLWYQLQGDYYIPCLELLPEDTGYHLSKYGRIRRDFLKEYRPALYNELLLSGKLFRHLAEIDKSCKERMEIICAAMTEQEGVTETLKAANQMEWVHRKNSIHHRAEEIILNELVYDT